MATSRSRTPQCIFGGSGTVCTCGVTDGAAAVVGIGMFPSTCEIGTQAVIPSLCVRAETENSPDWTCCWSSDNEYGSYRSSPCLTKEFMHDLLYDLNLTAVLAD